MRAVLLIIGFAIMAIDFAFAARCKLCQLPGSNNEWAISKDRRSATNLNLNAAIFTCQTFNTKANKKFCIELTVPQGNFPFFGIMSNAEFFQNDPKDPVECIYIPGFSYCVSSEQAKFLLKRLSYKSGDTICVHIKKGVVVWVKNGVRINSNGSLKLPPNKNYRGLFAAGAGAKVKCV